MRIISGGSVPSESIDPLTCHKTYVRRELNPVSCRRIALVVMIPGADRPIKRIQASSVPAVIDRLENSQPPE